MNHDSRRAKLALLFTAPVLLTHAIVAVIAGGSTALYFAMGLPATATFIAAVVAIASGQDNEAMSQDHELRKGE